MLHDTKIRAAIKAKRRCKLSDPAPRGAGRLLLEIRPGVAPIWYAARFVGGKQRLEKLGTYPELPLADARAKFAGQNGTSASEAVFNDLADAYLLHIEKTRPDAHDQIAHVLNAAARSVGRRAITSITADDIVLLIRPVYERGSIAQADKWRVYLRGCFKFALDSAYDYTRPGGHRWGLRTNPADAVPRDKTPRPPGSRWLDEAEFRALLADLLARDTPTARALAVLALTGQRVREIGRLQPEQWDGQLLRWATTKNGRPHAIPVCAQAAALLDAPGWQPVTDVAFRALIRRHCKRTGTPHFSARDLRRTWKTLAGHAGLTKDERDLYQHHGRSDVSSVHYDRFEYIEEKRAAAEKWGQWVKGHAPAGG
jgi:integrase